MFRLRATAVDPRTAMGNGPLLEIRSFVTQDSCRSQFLATAEIVWLISLDAASNVPAGSRYVVAGAFASHPPPSDRIRLTLASSCKVSRLRSVSCVWRRAV